jgi:cholesterol transport system auxiliary component
MSITTAAKPPSTFTRRPLLFGLLGLPAWIGLPALVGLPVMMSACGSSLLPKPAAAPARFTLDDGSAAPPAAAATAGAPVLIVAQPRAVAGCDDRHMVYFRSAGHLQIYADHEWLEPPAQMLAPLMVRALQASGAFAAVLLAPSTGAGVLRLETELIRLQQDFSVTPSRVRLTLRAVLIGSRNRKVLGWREFDRDVPAPSEDGEGGVAAARQATRLVLGELVAYSVGLSANPGWP